MEPRTLQHLARVCDGELREAVGVSGSSWVTRVSTDSRALKSGDVFFALSGDQFDGHDYLDVVHREGALAAVVARERSAQGPSRFTRILVDNPRAALGRLAAEYRKGFQFPVVAVAGSNGKTTTKELIASLLGTCMSVWKSPASYNNDVGVPLTLLGLERHHQVAVLEVGTNHPGELSPLLKWIAPHIGVLTNIGKEHLEYFGDLEGVATEEGELAASLPPDGVLIVGGESPLLDKVVARAVCRVIRVGFRETDDWQIEVKSVDWAGTTFSLSAGAMGYAGTYQVPVPGRHFAANAALALAVAEALNVSAEQACRALTTFEPPKQRFRWSQIQDVHLIDDTYNANEDSMRAALETLTDLPCAGRRVAVLGDMAELGPHAETAHAEVARLCATRVDALFVVGQFASWTEAAAIRNGLTRVAAFPSAQELIPALLGYLRAGDQVLVKASRSSRLEEVVKVLKARLDDAPRAIAKV